MKEGRSDVELIVFLSEVKEAEPVLFAQISFFCLGFCGSFILFFVLEVLVSSSTKKKQKLHHDATDLIGEEVVYIKGGSFAIVGLVEAVNYNADRMATLIIYSQALRNREAVDYDCWGQTLFLSSEMPDLIPIRQKKKGGE